MYKYKEITIENTMKLLIRCKLSFHARSLLLDIFTTIINYELKSSAFKSLINAYTKHKVDQEDFEKLQE
jgi:hypothetical protein